MTAVATPGDADAEIYEMISDGWRDPFNLTDRLTMPAFRGKLTPEEMSAVIGYLKSLWTPDQRDFQAAKTSEQPGPMTPN